MNDFFFKDLSILKTHTNIFVFSIDLHIVFIYSKVMLYRTTYYIQRHTLIKLLKKLESTMNFAKSEIITLSNCVILGE